LDIGLFLIKLFLTSALMHIAIDTLSAKSLHHGMGVYVTNLVNRLVKIGAEHRFILYLTRRNADYINSSNNIKRIFITSNRPLRIAWENSLLPFSLQKEGVSVFWGPSNFLPSIKFCKYAVTIHDITAISFPDYYPALRRFHYKSSILNSVRVADRIIVVSTQTKNDVIQYFKVPEQKVTVIHNGLDERFLNQAITDPCAEQRIAPQLKEKYCLPDSFIFTLGVLEPKKNVANLVRAYALAKKMNLGFLPKLVVGGSKEYGWKNREFFQAVAEFKLEDDVKFTGRIDNEDLSAIYQAATVFVFPSIYEGFGLPVIEAMACGTPVITSNTSSLPEIAGDAAILVNPYEPREIADALFQVLTNEIRRQAMIEKGRKNASRFSWDKAAQEILQVFEEAYKETKH
ncbi:MAG: glycosyltransferase family 4 protein, partial [bacterium]